MAKLTNFAEVDAFVIVASAETSLIEARDFPVPLITPLELEVALDVREWTGFYSTSFADLRLGEDEAERRQAKGGGGREGEGEGKGGTGGEGSEDEDEAPVFSLISSGFVDSRRSKSKPSRTTLTLEFEGGGSGGGEGGKAATTTTLAAYHSPAADFLMQVRHVRDQIATTVFICVAEVEYSAPIYEMTSLDCLHDRASDRDFWNLCSAAVLPRPRAAAGARCASHGRRGADRYRERLWRGGGGASWRERCEWERERGCGDAFDRRGREKQGASGLCRGRCSCWGRRWCRRCWRRRRPTGA